jgi:hypothetical protein
MPTSPSRKLESAPRCHFSLHGARHADMNLILAVSSIICSVARLGAAGSDPIGAGSVVGPLAVVGAASLLRGQLIQLVQKPFCRHQIGGIEPFGKPVIDRLQDCHPVEGATPIT